MWFKSQETEQGKFARLSQSIRRDGKIMSVAFLLQRAAQQFPQNTALIHHQTSISYLQLYNAAVALSKKLLSLGVKPRDRVIMMFENTPEFYIGYYAVLHIGAVIAPLNTFLKETEVAHIVNDAQPVVIIVSTELRKSFDTVQKLPPVITEQDMELNNVAKDALTPFDIVGLEPEEMIALLYTSGTTGFPKGVMLSSKNIMTNVIQGIARFELNHNDRMFAILPLFHSFPQNCYMWVALFVSATVILVPKIERRYVLEGLQHKPTIFVGVPALYGFLCLLKTAPLDSVRCFVSGSDALPDRIRAAFGLIYRRNICNGYGLTESSPMISGDLEDIALPTSCVGRPLMGITATIRDEQEKILPQGQVGQLWVKGDNIMLGYYQSPEMTEQVLKDGWLLTGDLAYIDPQGRIVISGRSKDLIINKGINIYPQEIENCIALHPNVMRVAVIGQEEEQVGEVPVAFVQLREKQEGIEKDLRALCQKNLAGYKVPREFFCTTDNLPLTATGKVDKKVLRAQIARK